MTVTPSPVARDWYEELLERIEPFITREEKDEMSLFRDYFHGGLMTARMKREKIFDRLELFVRWLKRKLLWSKGHNEIFFREISRIL